MNVYNLTHAQKRIWYLEKIHSNTALNNIGGYLKITGQIDKHLLSEAINVVIKMNDGLRLRFSKNEEEPYQYVSESEPKKIDFIDFSSRENASLAFSDWIKVFFQKPFVLENSDLFCFFIYKMSEQEFGIALKIHHIISDGWSIALIQKQVCEEYGYLLNRTEKTSFQYSYIDYIAREKEYFSSERFVKNKLFWNEKFKNLPEMFLYKSISSLASDRKTFNMDKQTSLQIRNLLQEHGLSLNTLFIAVMMIYMNKVLEQEDLVIGTPIANRTNKQDKNTVGMYTSTVPFRLAIDTNLSIKELLKAVVLEVKHCLLNQKYPYDLLISDLGLNKKAYDSLYKIAVNYYNSRYIRDIAGMPVEVHEYSSGDQSYSLQLIVSEWEDDCVSLSFDYKTQEYTDEDISQMYRHLMLILSQILVNGELKIKDIMLCSDHEINERIYLANTNESMYPREKTINQLFEEQAERSPEQVALIFQGESLTYKELNERANQLAAFLIEKGVVKDKIVAITGYHSFELIVGILGILKAGGAFLPVEPNYPVERVNYMLKDSGTALLLTNLEHLDGIHFAGEIFHLNDSGIYLSNEDQRPVDHSSSDMAYIIYTSGSTGTPKGVIIEHRNLVNYIWWANKTYIEEKDVFAFYSSISFDLTITSIFTPLISGSTVVIYNDDGKEFILHKIIKDNIATIVKLTPAHLTLIKDMDNSNSSIKKFIVGGDNLKAAVAREIEQSFNGQIEIFNEYGPTEATVGCMIYKYQQARNDGGSVPIGIAIDNTQIYILDSYLSPVSANLQGEIYISGDGVARGYLNRPELNHERFVNNPFLMNKMMYKTGDIAKYLPDGNIEYIGRRDNQAKIRGYRIELSEIEARMLEFEPIINAIALIRENDQGDKSIYAYYVSEREVSSSDLKKWLLKFIPAYMIPNVFIGIEHMPLTINGKVDVKLLPHAKENVHETDSMGDMNPAVKELVNTIKEILGLNHVNMADSFYQIGGDSIKAIQISSRLKNSGLEISPKQILEKEYIEEIAAAMSVLDDQIFIDQGICEGTMTNTPIMEWFFEQNFTCDSHYNQSVLLVSKKPISTQIINSAVEALIKHHDALRLNYNKTTKEVFYNNELLTFRNPVEYFDLSHHSLEGKYEKLEYLGYLLKSGFEREGSPLFKVGVFNLSKDEQLILFTAHHLFVDGISWRILLEDFSSLIGQLIHSQELSLPAKTHSFKEWSYNLAEYSKVMSTNDLEYWRGIAGRTTEYPSDFNMGKDDVQSSAVQQVEFDYDFISLLCQQTNETYGLEIHEVLLISLLLTINNTTEQSDIIIELEGHGREPIHVPMDISRTVGWFTSMYPVLFQIEDQAAELDHHIKRLKEQLRYVPDKGFTYGIFKYLNNQINEGKEPKRIRFNYLGDFDSVLRGDYFELSHAASGMDSGTGNHLTALLDITAMIVNRRLQVTVTYSKNRFAEETVHSFIHSYADKMREILNYCGEKREKEYTPSDFKGTDISQEDLDYLFN
ncbi:non-ribosomal peptide synthetase [Paenibacillus tengchongensis]|uniref:non-ribosomal peptide synthetase n=1 Tax=Paenibacillus tengchongensis TaxID=2608684 RepID=UPI00124C6871|nr:non-ribosomal peptide synthetase [Paenibacillus tengchongensis]